MSFLPKFIYRFISILNKIPAGFLVEMTNLSKIHMEMQKIENRQKNFEKKNKIGTLMLRDFKTYYKPITIKTVWYWYKDRKNR